MMTSSFYPTHAGTQQVYSAPLQAKNHSDVSFEIRTLESMPFYNPPLKTNFLTQEFYEIVWIKKGSAKLDVDLKTQQIHDNYVVFLSPGQRFLFEPVSSIEGYSIYFSQEFLFLSGRETLDLFHSAKQTGEAVFPAIQLDVLLLEEIELIVLNMIKEFSNHFKSRAEALQSLLKMLMIHLSRKIDYPASFQVAGADGDLLKKFMRMLDKDFMKKKMVNEYACDLFVTPNYLNEVIKRNTGFTASYHIQQRIILEAKRLAVDSEIRMKEIAIKLGYEDFAHFSKFFKANSGINFTNFRKQLYAIRNERVRL
jgi:AraC family transcriptional activator of pobA